MDSEQVSGARHSRAYHFSASSLFSGLTSFAELEQRIVDLPTPQERGDAFEVFAEAYLATQKVNQASTVWPDGAVPLGIVENLKLPPKDMGVDGVYQTLGGDYAAYQVKFRTGRVSQTWTELAKFIGLADRADLNRCADPGDLNRCTRCSRCRTGRCEFSARLLLRPPVTCLPFMPRSLNAAP
jgi:hypothetical protein